MIYSVSEVLEFIEENDVKFVRLAFCDLFGTMKNISILADELPFAFEHGVPFDGSSIRGFTDVVHSDLRLKPDPSTLAVLPWRPQRGRVVRFYCNVCMPDGETPFACDSRYILKEQIDLAAKDGYSVHIGEECEFYLFKQDEDGNDTDIPYDNGEYFDVSPRDKCENIRREICLTLEEMGIHPESSHHEMGPGQNEIVFRFADAMGTADNLLTFKNTVHAISQRNGVTACFDPKPIADASGNGLHVNLSVYKNDENLFRRETPEQIKESEAFMAGILHRIKEMTLFLNSVPESYARFGAFEAPAYISWSRENRAQLLRIPTAFGERKRCELRSPDPCINPYLGYALLVAAGMEGIREGYTLGEPVDMDLLNAPKKKLEKLERLPKNMEEAIACAKDSAFVKSVVGEAVLTNFIAEKEKEIAK